MLVYFDSIENLWGDNSWIQQVVDWFYSDGRSLPIVGRWLSDHDISWLCFDFMALICTGHDWSWSWNLRPKPFGTTPVSCYDILQQSVNIWENLQISLTFYDVTLHSFGFHWELVFYSIVGSLGIHRWPGLNRVWIYRNAGALLKCLTGFDFIDIFGLWSWAGIDYIHRFFGIFFWEGFRFIYYRVDSPRLGYKHTRGW